MVAFVRSTLPRLPKPDSSHADIVGTQIIVGLSMTILSGTCIQRITRISCPVFLADQLRSIVSPLLELHRKRSSWQFLHWLQLWESLPTIIVKPVISRGAAIGNQWLLKDPVCCRQGTNPHGFPQVQISPFGIAPAFHCGSLFFPLSESQWGNPWGVVLAVLCQCAGYCSGFGHGSLVCSKSAYKLCTPMAGGCWEWNGGKL